MAKTGEKIDALGLLRSFSLDDVQTQIAALQGQIDALGNEMRALRMVERSVLAREGKLIRKPPKPRKNKAAIQEATRTSLADAIVGVLARSGPTSVVTIARAVGHGTAAVLETLRANGDRFEDTGAGIWKLRS